MAERVWVFHRGALGDSVLAWPMMRMLRGRGAEVTFVADGAKARLAARVLGVGGVDAEQRRLTEMWSTDACPSAVGGVGLVVSFVADEGSVAGRVWLENARAMFPGAVVRCVPAPLDRPAALALSEGWSGPPARDNPGGPVVMHVGAGSGEKRWPMERWEELAASLRTRGEVAVIAGEAESERFDARERAAMSRMAGRFVQGLDELGEIIEGARVFVGCDTGPTHLAAQLGVAAVALFGPTDPARWAPIGPRVRVVAPEGASPMGWLGVDAVWEAVAGGGAFSSTDS